MLAKRLVQFLILIQSTSRPIKMKHLIRLVLVLFIFQSCIPLRIAPNIENYKVSEGKKFKRSLSKRQMFIFEDRKEAEEFYGFVNTKFELDDAEVYDDVPFVIDEQQYFFAWYEVEIPDKSLNLIPVAFDLFLNVALGYWRNGIVRVE